MMSGGWSAWGGDWGGDDNEEDDEQQAGAVSSHHFGKVSWWALIRNILYRVIMRQRIVLFY